MRLRHRKWRACLAMLAGLMARELAAQQIGPQAELVVQLGHTEDVKAAAFSTDGRLVLTGSDDRSARLWEAATGRELRRFYSPDRPIGAVAITNDSRFVLTDGYPDKPYLWDAATGKELNSFQGSYGPVAEVSLSYDARYLLSGGGRTAVLWDTVTGKEVWRFETVPGLVVSTAISGDGRYALSGGGRKVSLWNTANGQRLWQFVSGVESFESVAISPDGRVAVAGGYIQDATGHGLGEAVLLDMQSGRVLRRLTGHKFTVNSVAFSNDGKWIVTGSDDWTARLWDETTGRELKQFDEGSYVDSVALSSDGRFLLTATYKRATMWDVKTGQRVREFEGQTEPSTHVSMSPDDRYLLIGAPRNAEQLWDLRNGRMLQWFKGEFPVGAWSVSEASNGMYALHTRNGDAVSIAAGGFDEATFDWGAPSDTPGERIGTTSDGEDPNIYSPELYAARAAHVPPRAVTSMGGGACGSDDPHTPAGRLKHQLGYSFDFSDDCKYALRVASDGITTLWDVQTGGELVSLISFKAGGWAVVDAQGRFDTSDLDSDVPMHWVVDDDPMRALPLEIFMRDYYTPGLLQRVLRGEKLPEAQSIAKIKNRVQPDVKVMSVTPSAAMPGRVDVVVHAESRNEQKRDEHANPLRDAKGDVEMQPSGLRDLRLFRDGQMVADGYLEGKLYDGDYVFRNVMLKSNAGKVTFTAYAFNDERIKSPTSTLDYEPRSPRSLRGSKPHAYLLQIGVNQYVGNHCELHYAVSDADVLSTTLAAAMSAHGYEPVPVKLVAPANGDPAAAGKQRIREELQKIAATATPDDAFFMTFSGHGYSNSAESGGGFYILPSGMTGSCREVNEEILQSAISADELAQWLRPIDAGEMTLILDACDSAASVQSADFKPGPMGSRGLGQLAYDKRMRVLAASQADESAQESDQLLHGVLTYILTQKGLVEHKADWKPVDQKITVAEWLGYAAFAVPQYTLDPAKITATKGVGGRFVSAGKTIQIPALFDFSKTDTLQLQ